jgi:hypothetical protein
VLGENFRVDPAALTVCGVPVAVLLLLKLLSPP